MKKENKSIKKKIDAPKTAARRKDGAKTNNIAQNTAVVKSQPIPEDIEAFTTAYTDAFRTSGLDKYITDSYIDKFYNLYKDLIIENSKHNLTAVTEYKKVILLHFADSLLACDSIPENATVLDVGSGAGFPAFPLAIVRPDLKITALDATAKKTDWIAAEAERLSLNNISTITGRIEELAVVAGPLRSRFDVVIARAVASLGVLSEICVPAVALNGRFIAMKGDSAAEESNGMINYYKTLGIKHAGNVSREIKASFTDEIVTRNILVFEKTSETSDKYPRMYSQIKKSPLF